MTVSVRIEFDDQEVGRAFRDLDFRSGPGRSAFSSALDEMALKVQENATRSQIIRGGSERPHPSRLTSRTGTGRRSVRVNRAAGLVRDIGTDLVYMGLHELGGVASIGPTTIPRHTRRVVFGRTVRPFSVGPYQRAGYTARFPRRAYLEPALEAMTPRFRGILIDHLRRVIR